MKPIFLSLSSRFFSRAPGSFTSASAIATKPSSGTATPKSTSSARKLAPNHFFRMFFLCFVIAGLLAMREDAPADPNVAMLLARGWESGDSVPCASLEPGNYYEASNGDESAEFYFVQPGQVVARPPSWPEAPLTCRKISEPTNIEELQ